MIDRVLESLGRKLDVVIELSVDEDELVERLKARVAQTKAEGGKVRDDDNEETFRKRQQVYRDQTAPLIPYYDRQGKLRRVDGMGSIEEVQRDIEFVLEKVGRGS